MITTDFGALEYAERGVGAPLLVSHGIFHGCDGGRFPLDAFVSNPEMNACPLEALQVPTLLVHATDDPLASYDAAVRAAERSRGTARAVLNRSVDNGRLRRYRAQPLG